MSTSVSVALKCLHNYKANAAGPVAMASGIGTPPAEACDRGLEPIRRVLLALFSGPDALAPHAAVAGPRHS